MNKIKNIIFLGRKPMAYEAIKYLYSLGFSLKYIVLENPDYCYNLPVYNNDINLYELISKKDKSLCNIDLVISFLYWKKIKKSLINLAKFGCINFHPAPLPDFKGRAGYNTAILDKTDSFGVSAHYIDSEEFDAGPIIKVNKFPINLDENAHSLEKKTQEKLFDLFKEIMDQLIFINKFKTRPNKKGVYLNKNQLEKLKEVNLKTENIENINKKIMAFFFPPYIGANILVKGKKFTLINDKILAYLYSKLK